MARKDEVQKLFEQLEVWNLAKEGRISEIWQKDSNQGAELAVKRGEVERELLSKIRQIFADKPGYIRVALMVFGTDSNLAQEMLVVLRDLIEAELRSLSDAEFQYVNIRELD